MSRIAFVRRLLLGMVFSVAEGYATSTFPIRAYLIEHGQADDVAFRQKILQTYEPGTQNKLSPMTLTSRDNPEDVFTREELYVAFPLKNFHGERFNGYLVARVVILPNGGPATPLVFQGWSLDLSQGVWKVTVNVSGKGKAQTAFMYADSFQPQARYLDSNGTEGPVKVKILDTDPIHYVRPEFTKQDDESKSWSMLLYPAHLKKIDDLQVSVRIWDSLKIQFGEEDANDWNVGKMDPKLMETLLDSYRTQLGIDVYALRIESGRDGGYRERPYLKGPDNQVPTLSRFLRVKLADGKTDWGYFRVTAKRIKP